MRRNDEIQAALVAYLKSKTAITNELVAEGSSASEIREDQWKGTEFIYPNIRVRLISNTSPDPSCNYSKIEVSFMVFAEDQSSKIVDRIAGIINTTLNKKGFSSNSIAISLTITNLIPAIAQSEAVWRSEVLMSGIVSG